MKLVVFSDSHMFHRVLKIPECDVLISGGDYSFRGLPGEIADFHEWLADQPARHKISVQGNHELGVERDFDRAKEIASHACPGVHFVEEGAISVDGVKIWCSAITPWFYDWAYNRHDDKIGPHWDAIPDDTNILVTHGPPKSILDRTRDGYHAGCPKLMNRIMAIRKIKHHFFGHIHEHGGLKRELGNTVFHNVSVVNERYRLVNDPLEIEI